MGLMIDAVGYSAELTLNRLSGTSDLRTCQVWLKTIHMLLWDLE